MADNRWLRTLQPFVSTHLPPPPAPVLEIGCGPTGGFVPALRAQGYDAVGVDPEAPQGSWFHRVRFEEYEPKAPVSAVVACTSLHHVDDLDHVLDRMTTALRRDNGVIIVVEWAREQVDERTARWCFDRLPQTQEPGWLHRHRERWLATGRPWADYLDDFAREHGLHRGDTIVRQLNARFRGRLLEYGPYFFDDLQIDRADEQTAIDAGHLAATGIRYVADT